MTGTSLQQRFNCFITRQVFDQLKICFNNLLTVFCQLSIDASCFFFEPTSIFSVVFNSIKIVYKKNKETQKFCPLAPIFHLAPYLIFTATLKSIIPDSLVLVTKNEQFRVKSAHIRTTKMYISPQKFASRSVKDRELVHDTYGLYEPYELLAYLAD